jgi:hypothetical protein
MVGSVVTIGAATTTQTENAAPHHANMRFSSS